MKRIITFILAFLFVFNCCLTVCAEETEDDKTLNGASGGNVEDTNLYYRLGVTHANLGDDILTTVDYDGFIIQKTGHDIAALAKSSQNGVSYEVTVNAGIEYQHTYTYYNLNKKSVETSDTKQYHATTSNITGICNVYVNDTNDKDYAATSYCSGIPIFSDSNSLKNYLATGEKDENYLGDSQGDVPGDDEEDVIELDESQLIPPTQFKATHKDILECLKNAKAVLPDCNRIDATWLNNNTILDVDLKTEIQVSGTYMYSPSCGFSSVGSSRQYFSEPTANILPDDAKEISTSWTTLKSDELFLSYSFKPFTKTAAGLGTPKKNCDEFFTYLLNASIPTDLKNDLTFCHNTWADKKEAYRVRFYYMQDGKKYVSKWVEFGIDYTTGKTYTPATDTNVTDNDGNPVDSEYYDKDGNPVGDSSSEEITDTAGFFGWLTKQINAIAGFFKSIVNMFTSAKDAGTSFIDLFTAYNQWLPSSFISILVLSLGVVVFLRIFGR